jgi:nucleoid-associated protein YgaU
MLIRAKLMVLGLGEIALALALWRRGRVDDPLRWSDPRGWLGATTAENALIEVGRVVVLALVGWMVLTTALALLARIVDVLLGTSACVAAVSHVVPRFIVVMVVAAIATTAPALAQPRPPVAPVGPVRDGRAPTTTVSPPSTVPPVPTSVPESPPVVPPPATVPQPAPLPSPRLSTPGRHVVVAGESLWSIARDQVGSDDAALLPYWRALCDANRATLRSGDVNVIYPGETVVLP